MERKTKRRMVWLVLLTALAVVVLLPSVLPKGTLPPAIARIFDKKIQLGLDLKGGRHIVYGIALDRAVEDKATEVRRNLSAKLEEIGVEGRATTPKPVSYTHLRAHETSLHLVCRLLLEKKN